MSDRNYLVASLLAMCGQYEFEGHYVNWPSVWFSAEIIKTTPNTTFDIDIDDGTIIIHYLDSEFEKEEQINNLILDFIDYCGQWELLTPESDLLRYIYHNARRFPDKAYPDGEHYSVLSWKENDKYFDIMTTTEDIYNRTFRVVIYDSQNTYFEKDNAPVQKTVVLLNNFLERSEKE